jgi:superfamily II DNA/RNA helicase
MPFAALGLSRALVRAASDRGYHQPTAIQAAVIPAALRGDDVLASAQTGSGKTAAFGLALLQQLERAARRPHAGTRRETHALVIVPTRELAVQVAEVIRSLAQSLADPVKVAGVFGGVSVNPQMMGLRGGADIVVATPGRLIDLVDRHAVTLTGLPVLVLDEADRLLGAGFADELARIFVLLPPRQQTLLFSATFPAAVRALAQRLLHEPVCIDVPSAPASVPAIEQRAVRVDAAQRTALLRRLIQQGGWTRVLVFVATQYASEHVAGKLRGQGIAAAAFHGQQSQGRRTQVLADFRATRLQVLVATDVAARGIDIADLPVVVNHDLSRSAVDHVHRIGRTGRAGTRGLAISFVSADSAAAEAHFRLIEKRQGQRVPREVIEGFEPAMATAPAPSAGGIKGKRKSRKDRLREAAVPRP